jgi:GTPase SAR1 family protein
MNGTGDHHVKQNKPDTKDQDHMFFLIMWKLDLKKKMDMNRKMGDFLRRGIQQEVEEGKKENEGRGICSKYIVCMYEKVIMKLL